MSARSWGVPMAHMAYRVGGGPHLFRANLPVPVKGGVMMIDDLGFDGLGEPGNFCQEVLRECSVRGYSGVICNFDRPHPLLGQIVATLQPMLERQRKNLYTSEAYAQRDPAIRVLIPSALSGGSLRQRLREAADRYGPDRVVLAVERVAEDFYLPSPTGQGIPLTQAELQTRIQERAPSIFFSGELCAHYFTYMNKQSGAHFILFDDAASIRQKLQVAQQLGIRQALLAYPDVADLLGDILG